MMKLIWILRVVACLMVIGTIGSIEINRIDFYTAFLQIMLGFVLLILSNYWAREIRFFERKKSPLIALDSKRTFGRDSVKDSTCILQNIGDKNNEHK